MAMEPPSTGTRDRTIVYSGISTSELKDELMREYRDEQKSEVWSRSAETLQRHYDQLVGRWKEEMDSLLVYAGLFSAVLTAFNVQCYQLLQPSPTDATLAVLLRISVQLSSLSTSPSSVDTTHATLSPLETTFRAPLSAIWINSLWFSSLVCSLAAASIALIVKQWLRHAVVDLSGTSRELARLRQHRLDALVKWRVGTIVISLPILLQVALVMFLVGLTILSWTLDTTVASVTSSLVILLFAFFITVTVMPVVKWDCCYRSPQAHAIYLVIRLIYNAVKNTLCKIFRALWDLKMRSLRHAETKSLFYQVWERAHYTPDIPTWDGRDRITINRNPGALDCKLATAAYTITLLPQALENIPVVLSDLPCNQLSPCLEHIWRSCQKQWGPIVGPGERDWAANASRLEHLALYATRHMIAVAETERGECWRRDTTSIVKKLFVREAPDHCGLEIFISTLSRLSFGNDELAWTASEGVTEYWQFSDEAKEEAASYLAICDVLAVCSWRLQHWRQEDYSFDNLQVWLRAARCILLCISRSSVNNKISADEFRSICDFGREALSVFAHLMREQDWTNMPPEANQVDLGRGSYWRGILPHRLLGMLMRWVIEPMVSICREERTRMGVPSVLISTLQDAWTSVQLAFPVPLDHEALRTIQMHTRIGDVGPGLATLRALIDQSES